jgi:hypothetical protein
LLSSGKTTTQSRDANASCDDDDGGSPRNTVRAGTNRGNENRFQEDSKTLDDAEKLEQTRARGNAHAHGPQ